MIELILIFSIWLNLSLITYPLAKANLKKRTDLGWFKLTYPGEDILCCIAMASFAPMSIFFLIPEYFYLNYKIEKRI